MSQTDEETLQRICEEVRNQPEIRILIDLGIVNDFAKAVARRYAETVGAGGWQDISTVPLGVEVIVLGGKTVFGDGQRGSSVTVIDDRDALYRPDGRLRLAAPTMWHPAPAPPTA